MSISRFFSWFMERRAADRVSPPTPAPLFERDQSVLAVVQRGENKHNGYSKPFTRAHCISSSLNLFLATNCTVSELQLLRLLSESSNFVAQFNLLDLAKKSAV